MGIAIGTAVGGVFFEDRNSANYAGGAIMEVDWVRVYKKWGPQVPISQKLHSTNQQGDLILYNIWAI